MFYIEKIAASSQIHTKHINTLCGQNVELLNVKLVVHIVTTGLYMVDCQFNSFADGGDKMAAAGSSLASTAGSFKNSDSDKDLVSCFIT
jgi:hypothetical protein